MRIEIDARARAARRAMERAVETGELPPFAQYRNTLKRLVSLVAAVAAEEAQEKSQACEPLHTRRGLARLITDTARGRGPVSEGRPQ